MSQQVLVYPMFQGIARTFFIKLYFFPCNLRAMQISIYILCVKFTCKHNYMDGNLCGDSHDRDGAKRNRGPYGSFLHHSGIKLAYKHNYMGNLSCGDSHDRVGVKRRRGPHGSYVYHSTCRRACSHTSSCVRTIIFYF